MVNLRNSRTGQGMGAMRHRRSTGRGWSGAVLVGLGIAGASSAVAQQECLQWRLVRQLDLPDCNDCRNRVVAYDSYRGFVVMVEAIGLSHEWRGSEWIRIADALPNEPTCQGQPCVELLVLCSTQPVARCLPTVPLWDGSSPSFKGAGTYDAHRRVTVVLDINDTIREWDGQNWVLKQPSPSPGAITRAQMTYHPIRQTVVMFGGLRLSSGSILDELWEWDGTNWSLINSAVNPPARWQHAQAYDESRGVLVVFGGRGSINASILYNDIWEWDGVDWVQRIVPMGQPNPGTRYDHTMLYDVTRKVAVTVGGNNGVQDLTDVWDWNGQMWRLRWPQPAPEPVPTPVGSNLRRAHSVYDSSRRMVHLIAGVTSAPLHWAIEHPLPPEVVAGPQSQQVVEGNPVAFGVTTEPPTGVQYQWRKNGMAIPGANKAGYAIPAVTLVDQGIYEVEVSHSGHEPYPACGVSVGPPAALTVVAVIPGDFDGDGDVDVLDFAEFATMFSGPGG